MSKPHPVSRRQFLQTTAAVVGGVAAATLAPRTAPAADAPGRMALNGPWAVALSSDPADPIAASPPAQWALNRLRDTLTAKGVDVKATPANLSALRIVATSRAALPGQPALNQAKAALPAAAETAALIPVASELTLLAAGSDPRGLVYALTELADRVETAASAAAVRAALTLPAPIIEKPASPYRGIFRMFTAESEDKPWFYDRDGWQKYLDMLVTNRFNCFNLSFGLSYDFSTNLSDTYTFFLYPFMVNVPGYNVRAIAKGGTPLPADEQKKNLDTLKFISDQCALRGLKFTLGIWTHNYLWNSSPNATYTIDGLNAQSQAPYSRDAMKLLIDTCPGITGITLRTHGESGIPEGSYDLWKIIMSGIMGHKNADGSPRLIELDLHGKTMTQEMIDTAATTGMPLTISCKHWAEHMGLPYIQASIRESEMPKGRDAGGLMALSSGTRSFLRYGIGDLLRKDRNYKIIHRVWPGTQHLLLWGDPLFAAEYGRMATFAGTDGIDFFEPLSFKGRAGSSTNKPPEPDRTGYTDASLRPQYEWEKYLYTFRLWGRLTYNPNAQPETWQRQLAADFDAGDGPKFETALANASRILPFITTAHGPCAASGLYWPEMYANQSLYNTNANPYSEAPSPKIFGNVSSFDPQLFATVNEYVDSLLASKPLAKVSPLDVARQLEQWSAAASKALSDLGVDAPGSKVAPFRRAFTDASIAAGIGQFFAHKFRAALLWQLFNLSAHEPARAAALDAYKKARDAWAALAATAKVYGPNQPYGNVRNLQGHWSDRLPALDTDITGLATAAPQPRNPAPSKETIDQLIQSILGPMTMAGERMARRHTPPASFKPNAPLPLEIATAADAVRLCYRHLHQGQHYTLLDMQKDGNTFTAAIPADYTNSPFPLQYYFEIHAAGTATMHPGFKNDFTGTPYFTVLPA